MFGNLDIKTRPLRLAYIVDPNNAGQVRTAIQLSSTLWGGWTFPIIPLHKRTPTSWKDPLLKSPPIKRVTLGYLEAFDPDALVQLSEDVPQFVSDLGLEIIRPDKIWSSLNERTFDCQFGIGIFEILNAVFKEHFKYKAKYPVRVALPRIPSRLSLFWASLFGEIPSAVGRLLDEHYKEPLEIETLKIEPAQLPCLLERDVFFPRRLTQYKLDIRNLPRFGGGASVFFMDARKTEDIIDFWNLRALGRSVLPVPKQLQTLPELNSVVVSFLRQNRRHWPHNPSVCDHATLLKSRNSSMEEMQRYAAGLKLERDSQDPSNDPFYVLQHWYPRIWEEWARDKDSAWPADIYGGEESVDIPETSEHRIAFKPVFPKFAQGTGYHGAPRCANEVSFRLYGDTEFLAQVFPSSSGKNLLKAISGYISMRGEWRIGRHGLVKLVKSEINERRDIPASDNVFFAWLADQGWSSKISTPGLLAKQIYRQLEGHPQILLQKENVLGLLEHMNGGLVHGDGSPVDNNRFVQERDLPVGEVKSRVGESWLYEYLIDKRIFKLGARVQCPRCLRRSWFSLDNLRDSLDCPRCLHGFPAIGHLDSRTWSYKTTGPFSVPNYADGAYAVLLTLNFFGDMKMHTMRTTSVVSFTANAADTKELEADFGSLWQESLYGEKKDGVMFGECKTYKQFERRDFERMRFIAKTFPGAVLVFSTLRKDLTPKEITEITRIAKLGRKYWKAERPINPVLLLTGKELLTYEGPPYCWDEPIKTKYNQVSGLLNLCNVTQQIYLNLPPWEAEWIEKSPNRTRRRQARSA